MISYEYRRRMLRSLLRSLSNAFVISFKLVLERAARWMHGITDIDWHCNYQKMGQV